MSRVKIVKKRIGLEMFIERDKLVSVDIPNSSIIFNLLGGVYLTIPDDVMPSDCKQKIHTFLSYGQQQNNNLTIVVDLDNYLVPVSFEVG